MLFDDCLIFFVLRSGICLLNMLFVAFLAVHSFSMISPYAFLATFPVCACFVLPRFSLLSTLLLFGFPCCSCFLVLVLLFTAFGLGLADPCGSLCGSLQPSTVFHRVASCSRCVCLPARMP